MIPLQNVPAVIPSVDSSDNLPITFYDTVKKLSNGVRCVYVLRAWVGNVQAVDKMILVASAQLIQ